MPVTVLKLDGCQVVSVKTEDKDGYTDNVFVEVKDNDMHMYVQKEVVDDVIGDAVMHEMPCSPLRPPNRSATVVVIAPA